MIKFPPIQLNIDPITFMLEHGEVRDLIIQQAKFSRIRVSKYCTTKRAIRIIYDEIKKIIDDRFSHLEARLSIDRTDGTELGIAFYNPFRWWPVPGLFILKAASQYPMATAYLLGRISFLLEKKDFFCDDYQEIEKFYNSVRPEPVTDIEQVIVDFGDRIDYYATKEEFHWFFSRYGDVPSAFYYRGFSFDTEYCRAYKGTEAEGHQFPDDCTDDSFIYIDNFFDEGALDTGFELMELCNGYDNLLEQITEFFMNMPPDSNPISKNQLSLWSTLPQNTPSSSTIPS